ncbi:protein CutA homolog isoform X2 [Podarcis muralis]
MGRCAKMAKMPKEWFVQRCQALLAASGSALRQGYLTLPLVMSFSLLMYPVLRTLVLHLHSAVTGSYIPGSHSIALVNCPNEQTARDIARAIMERKLAACVNILPKASSISLHPFAIPEFISLLIDQGNPAYLKWMEESIPYD